MVDGLYALASLNGAPLAQRDRRVLGLPVDAATSVLAVARDHGGVVDAGPGPLLLGHVDDQVTLAATLGLDPATSPALLARAAVARFGDAAPSHILGEWTYLEWNAERGVLTLMASDTLRDRLVFATDGDRVAVASDVRVLARLDWVDERPDTANLLLHMGRATLRGSIGDRTILRGVRQVGAGTVVRIARGRVAAGKRPPLPPPVPWQGSFAEAVEALDAVLQQIAREQAERHRSRAVLLSGGLDSSIAAMFAARQDAQGLVALTSVAPPGSGLPDEAQFSRAVADAVGIPMRPVVPDADADAYIPSDRTLRWCQQPPLGNRHYLYDALYDAAVDCGADAVIDACEGEWSVTAYADGLGRYQRLKDWLKIRMAGLVTRPAPQDAFHVRLSAPAIAVATRDLAAELRVPEPILPLHGHHDMWGYSPSIAQSLREPTTTPVAGLRRLLPLRDRRLLTLFAGMPYRFLVQDGVNRAPGRALLAGTVPDSVRLRKRGLPFSPDYVARIRRQANPVRAHLPSYVRAGIGEWIDLAWLDRALAEIAERPDTPLAQIFRVQSTAMAAAFLKHWLDDCTGAPPERP